MIDKHYLNLIIDEVKKFATLKKQWNYEDLDDLIAHYIEEGIISSRDDFIKVSSILKTKLGIVIKAEIFNNWWTDAKQYAMVTK